MSSQNDNYSKWFLTESVAYTWRTSLTKISVDVVQNSYPCLEKWVFSTGTKNPDKF